jgi:putative uncharacterized protein (fragment)
MKFLLWFALVAFVVWKIGRDWRGRGRGGRGAARPAAEAAFERIMFSLECQLANGEIDEAQFRILREHAFAQLQRALKEAGF